MRSFKAAPEVLSAWMDERKLTAAELSRQTGIDAGILRKIMTGRETAVSTRNLMTLARYFGLSMQELIDHFPDNNDRSGHICGRSCLFTQCLLRPTRVKLAI